MASEPNLWNFEHFARVDPKTEEWDRLIHQKGVRAIWQRSMLCSCINEYTGQPDFSPCPACFGKGYLYLNPTELRVMVTTLTGKRDQMPIGLLDVGTALMTVKSSDLGVNFRDRITFPDFRITTSEILTYNSSESNGERLKFQCENMLEVRQLDVSLNNYFIMKDDQHVFLPPGVVAEGSRYSVLYEIMPVYIIVNVPHELRGLFVKFGKPKEEFTLLPKQFQIKREDMIPMKRGEV